MRITLDDWQKEVLEAKGNIVIRKGRQVGGSTIISRKGAEFALNNRRKLVLIVAATERQAMLMFEKTLGYLATYHKNKIKTGKDRPTKHVINLKNGSRIMCLPTGMSGYGIRGYTTDLLICDEAAFINDEVFAAVSPQLAVSGGKMVLLSTPFGKGGYFYDCFDDPTFKSFHISSEDCPRITKEFLANERSRMTHVTYAQEYLGEFIDELMQLFSTELIKKCMTAKEGPLGHYPRFAGVDIASMGDDQTVIASGIRINKERVRMIDLDVSTKTMLTETVKRIKLLDSRYDYRTIYLDDGGLGAGVLHPLLQDSQTKRKVVAINNASRSISKDDQRKRILKEDLYANLKRMMEQGLIELFEDEEIMLSLKSVQYEYKDNRIRIFGKYTHIAEALIRLAWCVTDKKLKCYIA